MPQKNAYCLSVIELLHLTVLDNHSLYPNLEIHLSFNPSTALLTDTLAMFIFNLLYL